MRNEQTIEKLYALRLSAMAPAIKEQLETPDASDPLSFPDRFGLLVDRQWTSRENNRLQRHLKNARLKTSACVEDIDYKTPRNIDKNLMLALSSCQWARKHQNIIIIGPTGVGKSFLASALANKACRENISAFYIRVPRLFHDLALAHADGSYPKLMTRLTKTRVLVLDDFAMAHLNDMERRTLLEVVEDRYTTGSTILTSQLPVDHWHQTIGDPTIADAILDRLVHNAHKIILKGESMRKNINIDFL